MGELRLPMQVERSFSSLSLSTCHFCRRSPILKRSAYNQIFHVVSRLESPCLSTECGVSLQKCPSCINHGPLARFSDDFNGYRVISKPSFVFSRAHWAIIAVQCRGCKALENRCFSPFGLDGNNCKSGFSINEGTSDDRSTHLSTYADDSSLQSFRERRSIFATNIIPNAIAIRIPWPI